MRNGHRHLLGRTIVAALSALLLAVGAAVAVEPTTANAAGSAITLSAAGTGWAKLGGARKSVTATVTISVPTVLPVRYGLQLRSGSQDSGYRAIVAIAADGTVTGSIGRVRSGAETTLLPATPLGFQVAPGDDLRLDAAVVATRRVWVYLRAGAPSVPSTWQLAVSDASGSRLKKAGRTYLWAEGSGDGRLAYRAASAKATTAARATAAGVVPPEPGMDTFSLAVIPDTQSETNVVTNTPFLTRTRWMVANAGRFDLRYVLHTGDVTNWGWLDPAQFDRAKAAIRVLAEGGLPYALAIGNHDTRAVGWNGRKGSTGYGGSAFADNPLCRVRLGASACSSRLLVRHTEEFNQAFPVSGMGDVGGVYAEGSSDNYWSSFTANGTSWLVLTLELWPRQSVVDWAESVVAAHPDHNVIIQTHHYLDPSGTISRSNGGYGATSPRYLYEHVVAKYPNVKLVFSGHNGGFRSRSDSPNGHTVVSYLGNQLSGSGHDPVRVVSINTRTGSVFTIVHDPLTGKVVSATSHVIGLVR